MTGARPRATAAPRRARSRRRPVAATAWSTSPAARSATTATTPTAIVAPRRVGSSPRAPPAVTDGPATATRPATAPARARRARRPRATTATMHAGRLRRPERLRASRRARALCRQADRARFALDAAPTIATPSSSGNGSRAKRRLRATSAIPRPRPRMRSASTTRGAAPRRSPASSGWGRVRHVDGSRQRRLALPRSDRQPGRRHASSAAARRRRRGGNIPLRGRGAPTLPVAASADRYFAQDPSVIVQLVNGEGVCWGSELRTASKNSASRFTAKAP